MTRDERLPMRVANDSGAVRKSTREVLGERIAVP